MDERREKLLKFIIEKYIETAEPVGSQILVESGSLQVSGATIRNEMRELEEEGLLLQPHTSAGRVPTIDGYKYYVDHLMKAIGPKKKVAEEIEKTLHVAEKNDDLLKSVSRFVAHYVNNAVFTALNRDKLYYTGFSNLFSQPEFRDYSQTVNMGAIFDECERKIDELYDLVDDEVRVLVGEENPLGSTCGTIALKVNERILAIIGPTRMDYNKGLGILELVKKNIK